MATLEDMTHSGPMGIWILMGSTKQQVLKDVVMAESLEPYLDRRILFFCGHFHADYHQGIPCSFR